LQGSPIALTNNLLQALPETPLSPHASDHRLSEPNLAPRNCVLTAEVHERPMIETQELTHTQPGTLPSTSKSPKQVHLVVYRETGTLAIPESQTACEPEQELHCVAGVVHLNSLHLPCE
jgi:hypothetical protein